MTPKQQQFVDEYLVDGNATRAAIRAGYAESGARTEGARLLANADIAAAITKALAARADRTQVTADRVIAEIAVMAFYDPAALVEVAVETPPGSGNYVSKEIGSPVDVRSLPEPVRRAIVGWGYDRNQNFTIKLADKSKALDQLMRHLGQYNDRLDINPMDGLADRLERAKARALARGEPDPFGDDQ
jgi:phage terminase small subunit